MTITPPPIVDAAPTNAVDSAGHGSGRTPTGQAGIQPTRKAERLLAVDALRGIAALAVVLFHVPAALHEAASIPPFLRVLFANGFLGVDAFFVLSGFVITMSVASGTWTVRYLARFIARRSVRLDPAYWVAIGLELLLGYIGVRYLNDQYPFPTPAAVASHFVYLQGLLGFPQISDVFWTLCFEIQFYLALVGLLVVTSAGPLTRIVSQRTMLGGIFLVLAVLSIGVRNGAIPNPNEGLAIIRAYQFGLGVIVFLFARGTIAAHTALIVGGGILAARLLDGAYVEVVITAIASAVCYGSMRSARLNAAADVAPIQFLGRISYSLYLYHASIVGRASTVTLMLAKSSGLAWLPLVGMLGGVLGSIAFAYIMFRLVELPTMQLSRRIRLA